ncbi:50S ribosomal protein L25/general stress protein Ctc [Leucobacter aridicollis]|uniref:50S ribosomal protein L25/general stress protein Ctc n=1 Tax=Leucobacter aridicollis TaxID=283878 RepID=UPI000E6477AB|nr:50S ribosomal protein L25/general stress protein Ctc [Leucobacter aridicollis]UTX52383.1 50S ribosomal protein L25/general stress protein Ctc [Leucobacter aridicollis]
MSVENKLDAAARDNFGKGAARKLRAAGKTPVVVYGHGTDPKHITVETHPLSLIVRQANALIELDIEGKKELVLVKDVQKDPVRQIIEHVDMLIVKKGEKVEVEVPIHVTGTSFSGTTSLQDLNTVRLLVPATSIPDSVEVSIEGAEEGTQILAGDLELPKGAELLDDTEHLVVQVVVPRGAAADEEDAEGAEEAAAE